MIDENDIKSLTPAQRKALADKLLSEPEHSDESQDRAIIQEYMEAISDVCMKLLEKICEVDEKCSLLEKIVHEEIIGGFNEVISRREKLARIEELKGKYPKFGEYEDFVKTCWGADPYELLADDIEKLTKMEGYTPESESSEIEKILAGLEEERGKFASVVQPKVKEVEIEVKESGISDKPEDIFKKRLERKAQMDAAEEALRKKRG